MIVSGHCRRLRKRHALYLYAGLDDECCRGSRCRQAQGFEPICRRGTLYAYAAVQAWAGSVKRAGTFDATRVAAALPRAQSKRPLPRFDSTPRETMPLLGSSFTAGATIPSKRSRRPDRRTNTARSVQMMNHPRHSDYALLTCVAVAAFLALAAMLSQLSCTPERPPEEYVPIRLVPLE